MTNRKNILTTATLVMVSLAIVITATGTVVSYESALEQKRADLEAIAQREAQVIEATFKAASTEHKGAHDTNPVSIMKCPVCLMAIALTKDVLHSGGNLKSGHGKGIEFVVGNRDGNNIRFLLRRHRAERPKDHEPPAVPWQSDLAEPMRMALSGLSGTIKAKDYRGETVLAAYAPVKLLEWGVVAKIDMCDMRAPFATSVRHSLTLAVLAILVGLIVLRKRLKPLIQESQDSEDQALAALKSHKHAMDEHSIVAVTDPSGKITYTNESFCRISQYSRDELIGQNHRIVNSGHHPRTFWAEAWKTIAAGNTWRGEVCNRAKDGSLYWVDTTIVPFKDDTGRITQHVAIRTDITGRKKMEDALKESKTQADAANRAKSEFLANMSHEIRTPMTAILGFAENMLNAEQSDSEKLNCVHTIRRNGKYLLGLVNDILDLSKIEAGKMTTERRDCQPCRIIAEVASLMHVRANERGLPFNIEYIGAIPETIHSDPTRLRQILINLIGNAIKFTKSGAVRLLTRFVPGEREDLPGERKDSLCDREHEENLRPSVLQFDVIDSGRGMTQEQVAKLFQPFAQADNSTTRQFGGTGLGLTISKRFAGMLGGDIAVAETELGVGSTFRATVATGALGSVEMLENPMSSTVMADTATTVAQVAPTDLHGLRILLAEDGPDNRRLIMFVLEKAGADVTVEENGKLALDAALAARDEGNPFDCILMDMQMPVMDGYEATGQLRRRGYAAPIIALTAHAMASDRDKCIKAGCDDFATKPINRAKLLEIIRRYAARTEVMPAATT